jgi:hypothetical protein
LTALVITLYGAATALNAYADCSAEAIATLQAKQQQASTRLSTAKARYAAKRAKADVLWSEDLQDGKKFDDVRVQNPLR